MANKCESIDELIDAQVWLQVGAAQRRAAVGELIEDLVEQKSGPRVD